MTACGDRAAEIGFRGLLHLLRMKALIWLGTVFLAPDLDPGVAVIAGDDLVGDHALVFLRHRIVIAPADQPLDGEDRVLRIGDALALGRLADQDLATLGKGNHRRRRPCALGVLDDLRRAAFHDRDTGVGGSEIDADCLGHRNSPIACTRRAGS